MVLLFVTYNFQNRMVFLYLVLQICYFHVVESQPPNVVLIYGDDVGLLLFSYII